MYERESNLPTAAIKASINRYREASYLLLMEPLLSRIDKGGTYDIGAYVSEFMAYHVAWYRDWSNKSGSGVNKCKFAGHTHVGFETQPREAALAVKLQLAELIRALKASP